MSLQDQLKHLEIAHELVKNHAAAQKVQLVLLRRDNEQLRSRIDTVTLTNKDLETSLQLADQKTAVLKSQNVGLVKRVMASRRQIFILEKMRWKTLRDIGQIEKLVNESINATNHHNRQISTRCLEDHVP